MPFVSCSGCGYVGPVSDEEYQAVIVAGETFVCTECEPEFEIEVEDIDVPSMIEGVDCKETTFGDVVIGDKFLDITSGEWLTVTDIAISPYSPNGVDLYFAPDHTISSHKISRAYVLA